MCLGIPGKIVEINDKKAKALILGVSKEISIALLDNINLNDYVIIHAGAAICKIDQEEAKRTIELFKELGEIQNA